MNYSAMAYRGRGGNPAEDFVIIKEKVYSVLKVRLAQNPYSDGKQKTLRQK